jgi:hypothetical protein
MVTQPGTIIVAASLVILVVELELCVRLRQQASNQSSSPSHSQMSRNSSRKSNNIPFSSPTAN